MRGPGPCTVNRNRYKPYGTRRGTDTITTERGFLNQPEDPTGLTYLNARYYDPTTGLFASVDPLLEITEQAYAYGYNNPVVFSDPSGALPSLAAGRR